MSKKNTLIVVAYPDRGEGNDPEPFFFFFFFFRGVGSLSQPRLNIFTVGNMRVMICLGQGGLRSLSASSSKFYTSSSVINASQFVDHLSVVIIVGSTRRPPLCKQLMTFRPTI